MLRKIATVLVSRGLTRATQIVSFVVLARALSPEAFGAYGALTAAMFLVSQVGELGCRQSTAYRIGQGQLRAGEAVALLGLFWPLSAAFCFAVLMALGRQVLPEISGATTIAVFLGVAFLLLFTLMQGIFLGRGEIKWFSVADVGPRIALSGIVAVLWAFGALNIDTALWGFALGFLVLAPVLIWRATAGTGPLRIPSGGFTLLRHGVVFALSAGVIMLQTRIGTFYLSAMGDADATGQFFAAQRGTEIMLEIASAVGLVLFSETARAEPTRESIKRSTKSAMMMFGIFAVIGICAAGAAPVAVPLLLGKEYGPTVPVFQTLAIGLAPASAVRVMNQIVAGLGRPQLSAGVVVCGLALNVLLCLVLVPIWGALGAAVALVAGQFLAAAAYLVILRFAETAAGLAFLAGDKAPAPLS